MAKRILGFGRGKRKGCVFSVCTPKKNTQRQCIVIVYIGFNDSKGDPLAYTLMSFVNLMDHNILSWDIVEVDFIKKVTYFNVGCCICLSVGQKV